MRLLLELKEAAKITLFCLLAAVTYGILHDQVTAHLCVEYFSIAHPPLLPTTSPFLLALGWGIVATWWIGLPLGLGLAVAARAGSWPRLSLHELRPLILRLLLLMALGAVLAGSAGAILASLHMVSVPGGWGEIIPPEKWIAFTADAWAHLASYLSGLAGGLFIIWLVQWRRWQAAASPAPNGYALPRKARGVGFMQMLRVPSLSISAAKRDIKRIARRYCPAARIVTYGAIDIDPGNLAVWIKVATDLERNRMRDDRSLLPAFQHAFLSAGYPTDAVPHIGFVIESQETVDRDYAGDWWRAMK